KRFFFSECSKKLNPLYLYCETKLQNNKGARSIKKSEKIFLQTKEYIVTSLYLNDRRRLSLIILGMIGSFPLVIFMSYVGLYLEDIQTAAWLIALILAFRNIYQIFLRIPLGQFSQIVGRKPLLIAGISCYTVSLFTMSLAFHWTIVLIAVTFLAIGMSCFWPVLFAYIGDIEKNNIGQLQGRVFQGTDMGTILGSLLAVLLLETFHVKLQTLFAWGAGISLLGVIFMSFYLPEVLEKEERLETNSKMKALGSAFVEMFRNLTIITKEKKLRFIYLLQLCIAFIEYIITAFFPFLIVSKGFPDGTVSTIFWISSGILIFFKPFFGKIVDKFSYKIPIFITLIISSTMLVLMTIMNTLPWLIVVYIFFSASSLTSYIGVNTGTTIESKPSQRGMALGALGFYVSLSRSVSTLTFSPILLTNEVSEVINSIFIATAIIILAAIFYINLFYNFLSNNDKIPKNAIIKSKNKKEK
ncbi:MAG: MFS transporter, partial [Candidatus Heimdallarchaeota archaeon]|nr:MFS transporter [Candidatus Heimdallarchaeota archaeon]